MAMSTEPGAGPKAQINVTPLVDVVLVLLIIFMVVTPILRRGRVDLPSAQGSEHRDRSARVLSLTSGGSLFLDDEPIALDDLARRWSSAPPGSVLLKADRSLAMSAVAPVLRALDARGVKAVVLAVDPAPRSRD
ncbi:MAG TPA: biopolymer transporter ExbD [Myxococcaceae bacterium]|nr:biopolymer transporter ExbD [Myxococcaceae bacterium]